MGFVIIDLEFNNLGGITQYYPQFYSEHKEYNDIELKNEIIEIGAVKLDKYMKKLKEYKTYIKPTALKILNPKITEITHITEKDLQSGISFKEAMDSLKELVDEDDIICSWAKDDVAEIINNAAYHNYTEINWLRDYLDIQEYCTKVLAYKKSMSLKSALERLKIKVEKDKLHDALNDAVYTSQVFKSIYNSRALKQYIIKDVYNMPAMRVQNLSEYKLDESKIKLQCPKCQKDLINEYPLKLFSWRFMNIGVCSKCNHKVLNEVIVNKTLSGKEVYKVISTILNEAEYMDYSYKFSKTINK